MTARSPPITGPQIPAATTAATNPATDCARPVLRPIRSMMVWEKIRTQPKPTPVSARKNTRPAQLSVQAVNSMPKAVRLAALARQVLALNRRRKADPKGCETAQVNRKVVSGIPARTSDDKTSGPARLDA